MTGAEIALAVCAELELRGYRYESAQKALTFVEIVPTTRSAANASVDSTRSTS